jgi:hypothetical protein
MQLGGPEIGGIAGTAEISLEEIVKNVDGTNLGAEPVFAFVFDSSLARQDAKTSKDTRMTISPSRLDSDKDRLVDILPIGSVIFQSDSQSVGRAIFMFNRGVSDFSAGIRKRQTDGHGWDSPI